MKKILMLLFVFMLACPTLTHATTTVVTLNPISPYVYVYSRTFDNLVLDFTLNPADPDTLRGLVVQNTGNARSGSEITAVVLYADDGNGKFDGFGIDREIATGESFEMNRWYFANLNEPILTTGMRFFVAMETGLYRDDGRTIRFGIGGFNDANSDGQPQAGDVGVFLSSETKLPVLELSGDFLIRYHRRSFDVTYPVIVAQNLADNQTITSSSYLIKGVSRDQGGSSVGKVEVCVNAVCSPATNTGTDFSTWEYDWTGLTSATYSVSVRASDSANNSTETAPVLITVSPPSDTPFRGPGGQPAALTDRYLKTSTSPSVYHLDSKNIRHGYPTAAVWQSWFGNSFAAVETVSDATMATYPLGTNEQFKDGSLIKIPSIAKVYKVEAGKLRWVKTEATATRLFGIDWNRQVRDLPEGFWGDYVVGEELSES